MDYQLMDIPPEGAADRSVYRRFIGAFAGVQAVGIAMMTLLGVWLNSLDTPGFGWDSARMFKFHPLFMTVGLVFLNSKAMLVYRLLRNRPKMQVKIAHACINLLSMGMTIAALVVVIKHKDELGYPHFYSLHSWIGIGAFALFELQWILGFLVFLYPGGSPPIRAVAIRVHRFCGAAIFGLSCVAVLTGVVQLSAKIDDYSNLSWSACVLNAFSTTLVLFGLGIFMLLSMEEFRRPPS